MLSLGHGDVYIRDSIIRFMMSYRSERPSCVGKRIGIKQFRKVIVSLCKDECERCTHVYSALLIDFYLLALLSNVAC